MTTPPAGADEWVVCDWRACPGGSWRPLALCHIPWLAGIGVWLWLQTRLDDSWFGGDCYPLPEKMLAALVILYAGWSLFWLLLWPRWLLPRVYRIGLNAAGFGRAPGRYPWSGLERVDLENGWLTRWLVLRSTPPPRRFFRGGAFRLPLRYPDLDQVVAEIRARRPGVAVAPEVDEFLARPDAARSPEPTTRFGRALLGAMIATALGLFGAGLYPLLADESVTGFRLFGEIARYFSSTPNDGPHGLPDWLAMAALGWVAAWMIPALVPAGSPTRAGRWLAGAVQLLPGACFLFFFDTVSTVATPRWLVGALFGHVLLAVSMAAWVYGRSDAATARRERAARAGALLLPIVLWGAERLWWAEERAETPLIAVELAEDFYAATWSDNGAWLLLITGDWNYRTIRLIETGTGAVRYRGTHRGITSPVLLRENPPRLLAYAAPQGGGRYSRPPHPPASPDGYALWSLDVESGEERSALIAGAEACFGRSFAAPDGSAVAWREPDPDCPGGQVLRRWDVNAWREGGEPVPIPLVTDWEESRQDTAPRWLPDGSLVVTAERRAPGRGAFSGGSSRTAGPYAVASWRLTPDGREETRESEGVAQRWIALEAPWRFLAVNHPDGHPAPDAPPGPMFCGTAAWHERFSVVSLDDGSDVPLDIRRHHDQYPVVSGTTVYGDAVAPDGSAWVHVFDGITGARAGRWRKPGGYWNVGNVTGNPRYLWLWSDTARTKRLRLLDLSTGRTLPLRHGFRDTRNRIHLVAADPARHPPDLRP